jgi:hypothetical protein
MACSNALTGVADGTCSTAKDGPDPRMLCVATPMSSCSTDGKCKSGACEDWSSSIVCVMASCSNGQNIGQGTCNGTGTCMSGTVLGPCSGGYLCATMTMCGSSCGNVAGTAGCQPMYYCDGVSGGTCHPQGATSANCTQGYQCLSGSCALNHKCN